jgi:hypothetical protein
MQNIMTNKATFTKSIKRHKIAPNCSNSFNSGKQRKQDFSLRKSVTKIASEINKILDHGYVRADIMDILYDSNITQDIQSNNSIPNIAIELLPKSEDFNEKPHIHVMASYNDSNRVSDHATRWNSR